MQGLKDSIVRVRQDSPNHYSLSLDEPLLEETIRQLAAEKALPRSHVKALVQAAREASLSLSEKDKSQTKIKNNTGSKNQEEQVYMAILTNAKKSGRVVLPEAASSPAREKKRKVPVKLDAKKSPQKVKNPELAEIESSFLKQVVQQFELRDRPKLGAKTVKLAEASRQPDVHLKLYREAAVRRHKDALMRVVPEPAQPTPQQRARVQTYLNNKLPEYLKRKGKAVSFAKGLYESGVTFKPALLKRTLDLINEPKYAVRHTHRSRVKTYAVEKTAQIFKEIAEHSCDFDSFLLSDQNYIFEVQAQSKRLNSTAEGWVVGGSREHSGTPRLNASRRAEERVTRTELLRRQKALKQLKAKNKQQHRQQRLRQKKKLMSQNYYERLVSLV